MSDDAPDRAADARFEPDPERVRLLREVADDVRGESSESEQLANVLYRTSDIFDPDEETTPEDVIRNVKFILEVKERGGLGR
ncbi:hypothetical protein [Haloarchaeobius sp. HRN-SO-5]|uniref:hypothetical protein n=1 Tax=Haloarchaeobius sp. HRN-SO-5 TaxID=3446118 RepID=UPI003EBC7E07